MISETAFTPWPPPAGEPIGVELGRKIIAWAKVQAPPLVAEAEHLLVSRHPGASDVHTSAWPLKQLAEQKVMPSGALTLGVVTASIASGSYAMVDVVIRPDGYLELRPGMGMGITVTPLEDCAKVQSSKSIEASDPQRTGCDSVDGAVLTIGYQGKTIDGFVRELVDASVDVLVDVRRLPMSRKPGFSKARLKEALEAQGIRYLHFADLGMPKHLLSERNLKDNSKILAAYRDQLHEHVNEIQTVQRIAANQRACLLCFESEPHLCHRSILADELSILERSISVEHL